jgi:hypothetical protein
VKFEWRRSTSGEAKSAQDIPIRKVVKFEDCVIANRQFAEANMEMTSSRNQYVAALTSEKVYSSVSRVD